MAAVRETASSPLAKRAQLALEKHQPDAVLLLNAAHVFEYGQQLCHIDTGSGWLGLKAKPLKQGGVFDQARHIRHGVILISGAHWAVFTAPSCSIPEHLTPAPHAQQERRQTGLGPSREPSAQEGVPIEQGHGIGREPPAAILVHPKAHQARTDLMTRTIIRSFDDPADAETSITRLEAAGLPPEEISIIHSSTGTMGNDAARGAGLGGAVGAGAGLLAGLTAFPLPGVGPVLAAGWLIGTFTAGTTAGAVAGGLLGALTGAGLSEDEAHFYAETIRRGTTMVSVRTSDSHAAVIEKILDGAGPIDAKVRRGEYERAGWSRFDETTSPP